MTVSEKPRSESQKSSDEIDVVDQELNLNRRAWKRITKRERLMLEAAVNFGLPVDRAGKVIKMSSRNANRIMKEQNFTNTEQKRELMTLDYHERQ